MRKWKCVSTESPDFWTVGKTYEANENGLLTSDFGMVDHCLPVNFTTTKFEEVTKFTKADLKPCMVVELRDKRKAIALTFKDNAIHLSKFDDLSYGITCLNNFSDDLMHVCDSCYDIMKVFVFKSACDIELLWERIEKSPTQLKLEELENKQREIADEIKKIMDAMGNVDITVKLDGAKFGRMVVKDNE